MAAAPLKGKQGFSLLELAIALVLAGAVASVALTVQRTSAPNCYASTKHQLSRIEQALDQFVTKHDRLPVPALRTAGIEDTSYGREAPLSALNNVAGTSYGALPFQALGLAPSYAGDCWGNKFTYAVTTALTSNAAVGGYPDHNAQGVIRILYNATDTLLPNAAWAVISHGANGSGAVKLNYRDPSNITRKWCNGSIYAVAIMDNNNCGANSNTILAAAFNDGKNGATNLFDDVVIFKGKLTRAINGMCSATANSCLAGTAINFMVGPCGTNDTWVCKGAAGGSDAACTIANAACPPPAPSPSPSPGPTPGPSPAPGPTPSPSPGPGPPSPTPAAVVHGACGSSVNSCAAGMISGAVAGACGTTDTWSCVGSGGGGTASCSAANAACTLDCKIPNAPNMHDCSAGLGTELPVCCTSPQRAVEIWRLAICNGGSNNFYWSHVVCQ